MDKRNKLAALIIVCLCLAGIFQRNMSISYNQRAEDASKRLYDYLCSYDFDGIDLDLSNDTVMLYEYVDLDGYPSTLEKSVVGTVKLSPALSDDAQIFQKIGRFGAGLLLAARINWAIGLEY